MAGQRIAIVGSGANGASVGADLTRAGLDVTLVEQWPEHVEAMRARGVRIEMPDETLEVDVRAHHLCDVATFTEPFDVVLVLMKAYDTRWACELIAPCVAEDGLVAGVQNGMTTDVVASVVGPQRTIGTVIEISSMMTEPGVVQRHSPPARSYFAVGAIDPAAARREAEVAALLRHSGAVETIGDIRAAKWMKLVSNCTTLAPSAILDLPIAAAAQRPELRELMIRAGREALEAGAALGHPLVPIFGLTAAQMGGRDGLVERLLDALLAGFVRPETTSTILHDWRKERRSEVGDINGAVVAALGGGAPANAAILELGRRIERGELRPDPANLGPLLELAAATR